ncbi:hypothetical protein JCM10207_003738 [Rhodosporidiobolus poonsookiae]
MASASSTIFYGGFVKALHLCAAAEAWRQLEPVFLSVDLICRKRDAGTLDAPGYVARVPSEVWSEVKRALVGPEIDEAYERTGKRCSGCEKKGKQFASADGLALDCFECYYDFGKAGQFASMAYDWGELISSLLAYHELQRPQTGLVNGDEGNDKYFECSDELHALTAIACLSPGQRAPRTETELTKSGFYSASTNHAIQPVDPAVFALPADVDTRLQAFMTLFRFTFFNPKDRLEPLCVHCRRTMSGKRLSVRPGWHLWEALDTDSDDEEEY